MDPLLFIHPIPPAAWRRKSRQCLLPCYSEYASAETRPRPICRSKIENATSQDRKSVSRRCVTLHTLSLLLFTTAAPVVHAAPARRTILDEERELNEQMRKADEENRRNALRAAFEAVDKASKQLEDVNKFVEGKDWKGIRRFARLFNNSVEREGMEPLTYKLDSKQQRQDSLKLCKQLTQALQEMDQAAKREDGEAVLATLQKTRQVIAAFQNFKP